MRSPAVNGVTLDSTSGSLPFDPIRKVATPANLLFLDSSLGVHSAPTSPTGKVDNPNDPFVIVENTPVNIPSIVEDLNRLSPLENAAESEITFLREKLEQLQLIQKSSKRRGVWARLTSFTNGLFDGVFDVGAFFAVGGAIATIVHSIFWGGAIVSGVLALFTNPVGWIILVSVAFLALVYGIKCARDNYLAAKKQSQELDAGLTEGIKEIEERLSELDSFTSTCVKFRGIVEQVDENNEPLSPALIDDLVDGDKKTVTDVNKLKLLSNSQLKNLVSLAKDKKIILSGKVSSYVSARLANIQTIDSSEINSLLTRGKILNLRDIQSIDPGKWLAFKTECVEKIKAEIKQKSEQQAAIARLERYISTNLQESKPPTFGKRVDIVDERSRQGRNSFMLFSIAVAAVFTVIGVPIPIWALGIIFGGMFIKLSARLYEQNSIQVKHNTDEKACKKILAETALHKQFEFINSAGKMVSLAQQGYSSITREEFDLEENPTAAESQYLEDLEQAKNEIKKTERIGLVIGTANGAILGALHTVAWPAILGITLTIVGVGFATGGVGIAVMVAIGVMAGVAGVLFGYRSYVKEKEFRENVDNVVEGNKIQALNCRREINKNFSLQDTITKRYETAFSEASPEIQMQLKVLYNHYKSKLDESQKRLQEKENNFKEIFLRLNNNKPQRTIINDSSNNSSTTLQTIFRGTRDFFGFYKNPTEHGHDYADSSWSVTSIFTTCGFALVNISLSLWKKVFIDNPTNAHVDKYQQDSLQMQTELTALKAERNTAQIQLKMAEDAYEKGAAKLLEVKEKPTITYIRKNNEWCPDYVSTPPASRPGSANLTTSPYFRPTAPSRTPSQQNLQDFRL